MDGPEFASILGPALAGALEQRGFHRLTPVQEAVLDPTLADRDLRITSQTGSGKTVAIGFAVRELVSTPATRRTRGGTATAGARGRANARAGQASRGRAALAVRAPRGARWLRRPAERATKTSGALWRAARRSSSARRAGCSTI